MEYSEEFRSIRISLQHCSRVALISLSHSLFREKGRRKRGRKGKRLVMYLEYEERWDKQRWKSDRKERIRGREENQRDRTWNIELVCFWLCSTNMYSKITRIEHKINGKFYIQWMKKCILNIRRCRWSAWYLLVSNIPSVMICEPNKKQ